ncbi:MAG TPA: beta-ribofuranosylaminobenzene 5'-phosphate synthase family protein [Gemmataceae bacterium]|nr:beta-ribofuranosylaminobenzene 5'-phosphate synthase family protein [Gemmataceae bacterium]
MIRVRTPSRLHFGLLSLPGLQVERWPNVSAEEVLPARRFGGVGLMVEEPGIVLTVSPAASWSAEGPLAERALAFARRFVQTLPPGTLPPHRLIVEHSAAEHSGLGTGTQLALAVARALAAAAELGEPDAIELARRVGRGLRSAVGIHGFAHGGFLVEGGKRPGQEIAPLIARLDFPEPWRVVLVFPPGGRAWHGLEEQQAFERLADPARALARTEALCRLVMLGMMPALVERDLEGFGEALYDFNVRAGEAFAPVQGGTYASPAVAAVVAYLRGLGARGVGQSSWGQAVFAIVAGSEHGRELADRVRTRFGLGPGQVLVTRAANHGAIWKDE